MPYNVTFTRSSQRLRYGAPFTLRGPVTSQQRGYAVDTVARLELTRFGAGPDGSKPAYYRMAELSFATEAQLQTTLGSPEGRAAVADLTNFATGGVTILTGSVES